MLLVSTFLAPSAIHGLGLFAAEPIKKGTALWKFQPDLDLRITPTDFKKLPELTQKIIHNYSYKCNDSECYILCFDDNRFINHSTDPNVVDDESEFGITFAARDIASGEELTTNYYIFDSEASQKLFKNED